MTKNKTKKSKQESLELTKTLVLNFNEVEKVAKYEKKTSKKPAIIIAIIGIFAIVSGLIYPGIYSLTHKEKQKVTSFRKNEKNKVINKLICTKNSTNDEEKITKNETITLNFKKNKLTNYNKNLTYRTTSNNLKETPKAITELDNKMNGVNENIIPGYKLTISKNKTRKIISEYNLKLVVNLKEFDNSKLTDKHKENEYLNVVYKYKDTAIKVRDNLIKSGYTCN
ncbi:MAG: hypothetical protein IJF92_03775 [Bacilli bacterium]|nr:hypothetical protein [Bacilli bacterium]